MDDAKRRLLARLLPAAGICLPFLLAVVAQVLGPRPAPMAAEPSRPALAFNQYLVDLGEVRPSEEVDAHFDFANHGAQTVKIDAVVPSCGCLQPQLLKDVLKPGESSGFRVRVQTANESAGQKEYHIAVKYHDPEPRVADLIFRVELPDNQVFVRPRSLSFYGSSSLPTKQQIEIIDRRPKHLSIDYAGCSRSFIEVAVLEGEVDDEGHWHGKLEVTVPGDLPPVRQEAVIRIKTDDPVYRVLRVPLQFQGLSLGPRIDRNVRPASGTR